jgi:hypothetical protein
MTTDAGFRVIGSNISSNLGSVNPGILTQTADTGQANWATATRAGVPYEIWKFTDSIGTLYFKIEYGAVSTQFAMFLTIGTGSNGSGTITGILSTREQLNCGNAPISTTTPYSSFMCCTNGALWLLAGSGATITVSGTAPAFFAFLRTCDNTGALTGSGYISMSCKVSGGTFLDVYAVNLSVLSVVSTTTGLHCLVPFGITSSTYGTSTNQIWRFEIPIPQTFTTALGGAYVQTEAGPATTVTTAIVGATTHTYFFTGTAQRRAANASDNYAFVLVYE